MLSEWIYGLPLVAAAIFGFFFVGELGFLVEASNQASFFAARSHFVGRDAGESVAQFADSVLTPNQSLRVEIENEESGSSAAQVTTEETSYLPIDILDDLLEAEISVNSSTTIPSRSFP